ncbi:glycosyltransferase family 2 protein [Myxococcota bacterium]|nr:glycosyltransferase family 2 protein [Myxococcota bacterium]
MLPLSVAIIARDEADRLPLAIASVRGLAREVVVVESGSSDDTAAVAAALGARVVQTDWPGHVAQKNRALQACTEPWVLCLDADEQVSPALAASIRRALGEGPSVDGYALSRLSWWQGAAVRHGTWYPDRRLRLVRRQGARWGGQNPHDRLEVDGPVGRLEGDLVHHPYRSLGEHLATIDRYTAIAAAELAAAGTRAGWADVALRPLLHFVKAYLLKAGFRDGVRGLCLAWLGASYVALKWGRRHLEQGSSRGAP